MIYKVLMFGDRNWGLRPPVIREMKRVEGIAHRRGLELVIIHGKAAGADQLSGIIAHEHSVHTCEVPALWETRGRAAGPQRNEVMRLLDPHEAVCFHPDLRKSRGSADMKRRLDKAGIKVKVVSK